MLNWLTGAQEAEEQQHNSIDDSRIDGAVPPTPGPATFAFQALRYGLLGTPKPAKPEFKVEEKEEKEKEKEKVVKEKTTGPPEPVRPKNEELLPTTPTKKSGQPAGILLTPGTTLGRKKSVTFGRNNYRDLTPEENRDRPQRLRSGLPASYPGKFPSPWTPKVVDVKVEQTERKEKHSAKRAPTPKKQQQQQRILEKNEMQTFVDEQIQAVKSNTAKMNELMELSATTQAAQDEDVTVNFDDPRSGSGRFWKTRYDNEMESVTKRVECYRDRKNLAVDYASKKDSQCSDLAVRLQEEMEARRLLQLEADKWQKIAEEAQRGNYIGDKTRQRTQDRIARANEELRDMVAARDEELVEMSSRLDRQRREIDAYREKVYELECELEGNEGGVRMADTSNVDLLEKIEELERQLDLSKKECEKREDGEQRLKREVDRLRGEQKKKTSQIAELRWGLEEAEKQSKEKDEEIARLRELLKGGEGMDDLHKQHMATVKDLRATQEQLATLRIEREQVEVRSEPKHVPADRIDDTIDSLPSLPPMSPSFHGHEEPMVIEEEHIRLPPLILPNEREPLGDVTNTSALPMTFPEEKPIYTTTSAAAFASPRPKIVSLDRGDEKSAIDAKRASAAARVAARKAAMKAAMNKEN